jgi:predicted nucleotidyltransferase
MAEAAVMEAARYLKTAIENGGLHVDKVILFGSHAKGRARPDSDVDIAVVLEEFREKGIVERIRLIRDAEIDTVKKYLLPIEVVRLSPEEYAEGNTLISREVRYGNEV